MLAQFRRVPETRSPSMIIKEIRAVAPPSIIFTNFSVQTESGTLNEVRIQGQAPTREALASLKTALESAEMFDSVALPLGDLARDEDLPFAIVVTLAKQ